MKMISKLILHGVFLVLSVTSVLAQQGPVEHMYPKTIHIRDDSFFVKFSNTNNKYPITLVNNDTVDMGTDGSNGLLATIYTGTDSVKIPYKNLPYFEVYWINVQSPRAKSVYRLHFNNTISSFSEEYIRTHSNTTWFELPEVYELANIIWALSPSGMRHQDIDTSDVYYKKVMTWFKLYSNHPIFKKLDFPDSVYYNKYYDFRENSYTYKFSNSGKTASLINNGPYYYVMGDDWDTYNSLFKELLPLVQDFAQKSNYRQFYKSNAAYYAQQIKREQELMPVKKMWEWLEGQFPNRFMSYKVVFSPLITGSHSTQNFGTFRFGNYFNEAVMYVCGPTRYDRTNYTEKQKEGLASGIVFTEIDHNYVNRVTGKYRKRIDSIFNNRSVWAKGVQGYQHPTSVFNEYMTHSLFCLYIYDSYDKETADLVVGKRVEMMVKNRGFIKFGEYNDALVAIRNRNPGKKAVELYPEIIDWCKQNNQ